MQSAVILIIFYLILNIPPISLISILKKDRKKYFIFSSIYAILLSFVFFKFGYNMLSLFNVKQGTINYTMYVYKNLFIFSPLLGLFFVSLHRIFEQKKQLKILIALKYVLPTLIGLIFMKFLKVPYILWLLASLDIFTTILSLAIAIKNFQK